MAGPWPPGDAVPVPLDGFYDQLAERGYGYGPAFQGLAAAWRREDVDEVFAEVRLPQEQDADAARFGVHPALLDAALHAVSFIASENWYGEAGEGGRGLVPFSWSGAQVTGRGARMLRVRLRSVGTGGAFAVLAADEDGQVVVSVDQLVLRPMSAEQLQAARVGHRDSLFAVEWVPVTGTGPVDGRRAVLGGEQAAVAGLTGAGPAVTGYADPAALAQAAADGQPVPPVVMAWLPGLTEAARTAAGANRAVAVRAVAGVALELLQGWLSGAEFASSVLVVMTEGAVAADPGELVADLAGAAVWGLVRSAQTENPGRFVLADVDGLQASWQALASAAGSEEPELVIRRGRVLGRRLVRAAGKTWLPDPAREAGGLWRLDAAGDGTLGGVRRVAVPEVGGPLGPGQIRIAVRSAGLNFRDALITLGIYPDPAAVIGSEGAGVVTGTGPGVTSVQTGDRVLGIWVCGLGPVAVAQEQMIAKIPAGWSFAQAASVPVVFATAYYALVDLAVLRPG
ncbi:MAG TPA: polyketide synthase dehydratase domain-containing protein, partial [Streptosporangiaceae bacterium]|nr:polyketide synthase dehydratase domain-containing protein [Streptosporangiaceae bacterium]